MSSFFDLSTITKVAAKATTTKTYDCSHCKAFLSCRTSKIPVQGEGRLNILIVLDEVSLAQENSNNDRQGSHYLFLKKKLKDMGIDIHKDCWTVNAVRCYINDKKPGAMMLSGCGQLLTNDIKRLKPKGIIITSELAWDVVFSNRLNNSRADGSLWDYAGSMIPDQELKVWLFPIFSTHLIIEAENEVKRKQEEYGPNYKGTSRFEPFYTKMLSEAIININVPVPIYEYESKVKIAKNVEEAISFIKIAQTWPAFAFDYETTGLSWHRKEQQIHSVSYSNGEISYAMLWYKDNPTFMSEIKKLYQNDSVKIAYNKGFERSWSIGRAYVEPNNLIHDPMLMAHAYLNLAPTGLKYWLTRVFGIAGYDDDAEEFLKPAKAEVDKYGKNAMNTIFSAPKDKILLYVGLDSLFTYWLAKWFQKKLDPEHQMPGYKLLARGERPLTHMHLNGLRVDMEAIRYWKPVLQARIDEQYTIIMDSDIIKTRWMGGKFKPGSDTDLRRLIYDILKFKPTSFTDKGLPSVDADALDSIIDRLPIAINLLEYRKWYKLLYTFITGLEREQWEGVVHPYFTLNNVDSYRSACIAKGTKILTNNDYNKDREGTPIEDVKVGDYVVSIDENLKPTFKKVLWAGKTGNKAVIRVHYLGHGGRKGYVDLTPEHEVMLHDGRWVQAQHLLQDWRDKTKLNWKHLRKSSVMSVRRETSNKKDRLFYTGTTEAVLEHRVAYEAITGNVIPEGYHVHHKDDDHTNHAVSNLECIEGVEHSRKHFYEGTIGAGVEANRQKGLNRLKEMREQGLIYIPRGIEESTYIQLTATQCLREIVRVRGRIRDSKYGFEILKRESIRNGLDIKYIVRRFNSRKEYVSRWKLFNVLSAYGLTLQAYELLGKGYATIMQLTTDYGITYHRQWGNQTGVRTERQVVWNNHAIVGIEELSGTVDVYDLTVEDAHNFIANEICVHNCRSPNLQNISKHQKDVMEIVRSMVVPHKDNMLTSTDFSTLEVLANAAITQDQNLLKACLGAIDQHTELAKRVFMVQEVPKPMRSYTKGAFTFRWMYGGTGMQSAEASWQAMHSRNVIEQFGMDIMAHLKKNGIHSYEDWEANCVKAEKWFFGDLFFAYQKWRKDTYAAYQKNGYLYYPNGFTYQGVASRNSLLNGPGQGAGSHVTLNALIGIFEEIEARGMKSKLINIIHDDIMGSVPPEEEELFKKLLYKHMVAKKSDYNPWLGDVPMTVVYGKAPINEPWSKIEDEGVLGDQ